MPPGARGARAAAHPTAARGRGRRLLRGRSRGARAAAVGAVGARFGNGPTCKESLWNKDGEGLRERRGVEVGRLAMRRRGSEVGRRGRLRAAMAVSPKPLHALRSPPPLSHTQHITATRAQSVVIAPPLPSSILFLWRTTKQLPEEVRDRELIDRGAKSKSSVLPRARCARSPPRPPRAPPIPGGRVPPHRSASSRRAAVARARVAPGPKESGRREKKNRCLALEGERL